MTERSTVVEITELSKRFGRKQVLERLSGSVRCGSIVGVLGANGAGKSTLLRHLVGLYVPDSGSCRVFDCEARDLGPAQLLRIGYVHQEARLLEWMRVEQLLRFVSAHYPTWNRDVEQGFISTFEVPLRTRVAALSSGERQKLSILLAIGHEPELLVLDEPATALDPVARARFLGLLMGFIQDLRRTVIISSHILSDVEKVIDHVWLLSDAALICDVPFDELQERYLGVELSSGGACPPASAFPGFVSGRSAGREASLVVRRDAWSAADLSGYTVRERNLDLEGLYRAVLSERKGGEL